MSLYVLVKHLHLTLAGLAALGFVLRFARLVGLFPRSRGANLLHLADMGVWLTLLTGGLLIWLTGQTSLSLLQPWLLGKLLLLVAALMLASQALSSRASWPSRWLAFLAVLGLLYAIVELALHKRLMLLA